MHLAAKMREIVHVQAGQCGNQIGAKVRQTYRNMLLFLALSLVSVHFILAKVRLLENVCAEGGEGMSHNLGFGAGGAVSTDFFFWLKLF